MNRTLKCVLLFFAFFCFYIFFNNFNDQLNLSWIMNFHTRDLARAAALFKGNFIFFGPETTNGASLPGPFYYILLLPAMLFKDVWLAAWWWMIVLASASASIAALYFRKTPAMTGSLLYLVLFLLMPTAEMYYTINVNPSYLFIFTVLALIFGIKTFEGHEADKNGQYFALACGLVGLGIQLHFSIIFVFISMLVLQFFSKRLGLQKLTNKQLRFGVLCFLLPLVPFVFWVCLKKMGITLGQESSYPGIADHFSSTFLYLFKNGAQMPLDYMLSTTAVDFLKAIPAALLIFPFVFLKLNESEWLKIKSDTHFTEKLKRTKILLVFIAICVLPYLYNIFIKLAHRYGMGLHIASLFLMVTLLYQIYDLKFLQKRFIFITLGTLLVSLIFIFSNETIPEVLEFMTWKISLLVFVSTSLVLILLKLRKIPALFGICIISTVFLTLAQAKIVVESSRNTNSIAAGGNRVVRLVWKNLFKKAYEITGWSYAEAKDRLYVINAHDNNDLELAYNEVVRDFPELKGAKAKADAKPDGLIVAVGVNKENFKEWLLSEPIHEDLKKAIQSGHISFGIKYFGKGTGPRIILSPYYVKNTEIIPKTFHSNGLYYKRDEHYDMMKLHPGSEVVYTGANQETIFQWNECPDLHPFCNAAAMVNFNRTSPNNIEVSVKIVGESLSQASVWIHPNWTAAWDFPFIEVQCGQNQFKKILSSSIGYKREYLKFNKTNFFTSNNSIIAPYEKRIDFACSSDIEEIRVGRASSTIDYLTGKKVLPANTLSKKF